MPLFMPDEELARLASDGASVVPERADEYKRKMYAELDSVRAKADAASITAEQTCSLLEQRYLSLNDEFSSLESQNAQLQSDFDNRLSILAESQAETHQLQLRLIESAGEAERLRTDVSELRKSKVQLTELLQQKDNEISEIKSTIKTYSEKIVKLTDTCSEKEALIAEARAELARSQAMCRRFSQEKELSERHAKWLDEELTAKVDSYAELRRRHADLEAEMSANLVDVETKFNECSSSLIWHKESLRELETKASLLQEDLSSCKVAATTSQEQYNAELFTANKLVELHKERSEEWSMKAAELGGVIKALEARLSQVENGYQHRLDKEYSTKQLLQKENEDLKQKLEKCEAEIKKTRKTDELNLIPLSSFTRRVDDSGTNNMIEEDQAVIPKVPAGVSATALAASLLRDGWSLAKVYEKYQEAVDALRHEQLGRQEAESILQRVLSEIEQKVGVVEEERGEYARMVESYSQLDKRLQDSVYERSNLEKYIMELKADLKRQERENNLSQKDISDLQKQVTILLKECRDVQLRCGAARDDEEDDPHHLDAEMDMESEADQIIPEHLLKFKDINGLVEQNAKLRNLVRSLSEQIESSEMELTEQFEKKTEEASSKVAIILKRAEEQDKMIESLHTFVAMYEQLYEGEQKLHSSHSRSSDLPPDVVPGRKKFLHQIEDSQEATKRAQEKAFERVQCLEKDLEKARSETIAIRSERDKLDMEANFAREKLEGIMKESERKREEIDRVLARNIEFSQLNVDHQRKLRESSESLHSAEEISRKLSMEVSVLKQEKEVLSNAEKRASDEVSALSQRVYRLQATLDSVQSTEKAREEERAAQRRKEELHVEQLERECAEAKKELQEERSNVRNITSDRNQTFKIAATQVKDMGSDLANALKAVSAAESRASVAEATVSDLEKNIRFSDPKALDMNNAGVVSLSENEMSEELRTAKEEMEKLRGEVESSRSHMLQYKSIAQVNETALKQMDSAHENFRLEGEKKERLMEAEIVSLREKVLELQNEIASLREESVVKISQMEAMNTQMSTLKNNLEKEHEKWRDAQRHYERQVILQSETIQELTNTSQALAALQEEASELRKLAAARETENSEIKSKWSEEKPMLEQQRNLAEKKYHELNEQNKLLHNQLEAMDLYLAEKGNLTGKLSCPDSSLQSVVTYLHREKGKAEEENALLKTEKSWLQSQLERAVNKADREFHLAQEETKRLKTETDLQQKRADEASKLREDVARKLRKAEEELEKLLEEKELQQKRADEAKEDFARKLQEAEEELEKLLEEKELQQKRADEAKEDFARKLREAEEELEKLLEEKDLQQKRADEAKEDLARKLREAEEELEKLEEENTKQRKDYNNYKNLMRVQMQNLRERAHHQAEPPVARGRGKRAAESDSSEPALAKRQRGSAKSSPG